MSFESRYQKLNAEQKLAVDTIEGPVMVVAGPGTGKTELLGLRVANILRQSDALPSAILCLTFTESGASNMRERLVGLIGAEAYKVAIHTFHGFALDVTHQFREDFYEARQMQSADDIRQIETLGQILEALPFSDALSQKGHDGTYFYLNSIKDRIGKLKKAGITPSEFEQILYANSQSYDAIEAILVPVFTARMSKATREAVPELISQIKSLLETRMPVSHSSLLEYQELLASSLEHAYSEAVADNNTKALTAWKEEWLKKDSDNSQLQLKDKRQLERNLSLAHVYAQYQRLMADAGFVDFDDMIMDLIQALIKKPGLLAELQEKYQYILVDEFQDTNEAQMRIVNLLADNPVHEGRPNIMVVGDDDQSIFKFQGAEINNVLQFQKQYPATKFITLNKNYRSTAAIVDFSQLIIKQGQDRLTDRIEAIKKNLEAANPEIASGEISAHSFDTAAHEYAYIINEIKNKISAGTEPNDIAVIARNHRQLEEVAAQLQGAEIAVQYERQRNVLEEPHIKELIALAKLVVSLATEQIYYQQELLVEVLSASFWGLERKAIWTLAIEADERRKHDQSGRWLDAMMASANERLQAIATWLMEVAARAQTEPLNNLIDELIGPAEMTEKFSSPFRRFYFNKTSYSENPEKYLQFLASLNTFINKVRNFAKKSETPRLSDLVECVNLHEKHGLAIIDTSPNLRGSKAVTLLSAHKAKGLEFDTVFVINCQENIWGKSQGHDLIAFPKNLAIDPSGETIDDYLRLFFVALTRAKRHLYLTSYTHNDSGKASLRLPFLEAAAVENFPHNIAREHKKIEMQETIKSLESSLFGIAKVNSDEQSILQPILDKYILSVTHLNNFLNITHGGPQSFFEQNLLRFPQAKTAVASYGTAVHATMEAIYAELKKTGIAPTLNQAKEFYREKLTKENLAAQVLEQYLDKGNELLRVYLIVAASNLDPSHLIEVDFRTQQVMIESVPITGKIDKVVPHEEDKIWEVYDFKTGKVARDWKGKDENEKIKLHGYKRQLIFYKLLVELSRDYNKYQVKSGSLEFLNPTKAGEIIVLPYQINEVDVERMKKLIVAVDKKIRTLDFPDISKYEQTLSGILEFEEDLINGKV